MAALGRMRATIRPPETCYSMRNYRFERDSQASDSTSFKDYSTCQSAAQFQAKTVVSPGMVRVR